MRQHDNLSGHLGSEQIEQLQPYFDWAINEQCKQYDECDALIPLIDAGKAVLGVEYQGDPASSVRK